MANGDMAHGIVMEQAKQAQVALDHSDYTKCPVGGQREITQFLVTGMTVLLSTSTAPLKAVTPEGKKGLLDFIKLGKLETAGRPAIIISLMVSIIVAVWIIMQVQTYWIEQRISKSEATMTGRAERVAEAVAKKLSLREIKEEDRNP